MPRVRKQARAETDLIDIWLYTYEQWGEAQAEQYFDALENGINKLGRHPELGRRCDHIRQGYFSLRINRHVVYYTVTASTVHVIRVLHERMDPGRQFSDS